MSIRSSGYEASIACALQAVGGVVAAALTHRRDVHGGIRVVATRGQKLKHVKREGGAALAQVDLDGDVAPAGRDAVRDEVDSEPPQYPMVAQHLAHPPAGPMHSASKIRWPERYSRGRSARLLPLAPDHGSRSVQAAQWSDAQLHR
jgi:hypothetical protein